MNQPQLLQARGGSVGLAAAGTVRAATASAHGSGPGASLARNVARGASFDPDKIFQEVMSQTPQPGLASPLASRLLSLAQVQGARPAATQVQFPPLGRVPLYNPAQDTQENFEQACARLASQLDSLRSGGALELHLLAFRLQRQAELDQMFPKQALRLLAEEQWRAAARLLKDQGAPAEEIRKYLKGKAMDNRLPSPDEVKAFIERRRQAALELAKIAQGVGAPAPVPGAPPPAPVRGQSWARPPVQPGAARGLVRPVVMHKL
jgi:hypothetical protein